MIRANIRRWLLSATILALMLAAAPQAQAWHWVFPFAKGPWQGAGGNYYTGSPRSKGVTCSSCHIGQSRFQTRVGMQVVSRRVQGNSLVPDDIFSSGYQPGARYKITVTMIGEHRGFAPASGQYQDSGGLQHKLACPLVVDNLNLMTAEVMNEGNVYADFDGNAAGTIRADTNTQPDSVNQASRCLVATPGCGGGAADYPPRTLQGGPTTVSYRSLRLTDPNSSPPFGSYGCSGCDAIVSMYGADITPTTSGGFPQRVDHFFWTAPSSPPSVGNGRIRFYMAFLDGDGYRDVYDDDYADFRRAVCPVGNAGCNPTNPPWNFTSVPPAPVAPVSLQRPAPPTVMLGILSAALMLLLLLALGKAPSRRLAMAGATAAVLLGTAVFAGGCVNVKAWERGRMATLCMSRGPDVEEAMIERTFLESREGSSGGSAAAAGGGCACN